MISSFCIGKKAIVYLPYPEAQRDTQGRLCERAVSSPQDSMVRSFSELPQVMIDVLGSEYSPLTVTQSTKGGMQGKGFGVNQS